MPHLFILLRYAARKGRKLFSCSCIEYIPSNCTLHVSSLNIVLMF